MRIQLVSALLLLGHPVWAIVAHVGDEIELRATHHLGVPLHRIAGPTNDFQRVPDGARATVLAVEAENWHQIRVNDGREGWVVARYVNRVLPPGDSHQHDEEMVWRSRTDCRDVVDAGRRMPKNDTAALLIGTWNIRWFNRGCSPQQTCPEHETDIAWAACAISSFGMPDKSARRSARSAPSSPI